MKRTLEILITGLVSIVFFGVLFQAPISVWADVNFTNTALFIKSWKEILLGIVGLLLIILVCKTGRLNEFLKDKLLWLIGVIGLLHVILLITFKNQYISELAGLLIDLRMYLFLAEVYILLKVYPSAKRPIFISLISGVSLVMIFALLQVTVLPKDFLAQFGYSKQTIQPYLTVDLNPDYIRINSTLRGPNPLGALAVMILAILLALAPKYQKMLSKKPLYLSFASLVTAGALMALWFSYSRSALGAFVIAVGLIIAFWLTKKVSFRTLAVVALAGVLVLTAGLMAFKDHHFVQNVVFHNNSTGGSSHKSDDGHVDSLAQGLEATVSQPLGAGIGGVGSASLLSKKPLIIENQYLYTAHESGWLGLFLQIWLFGWLMMLFWQNRKDNLSLGMLASGVGLAIIGLVLPVWADDTVGLIWWGLAGMVVAGYNQTKKDQNERKNHKKTKRTA